MNGLTTQNENDSFQRNSEEKVAILYQGNFPNRQYLVGGASEESL